MEIVIKSNQIEKKPHPLVFVIHIPIHNTHADIHREYLFAVRHEFFRRLKLSLNSKYNSAFFLVFSISLPSPSSSSRCLFSCKSNNFGFCILQIIEIWIKLNISLSLFLLSANRVLHQISYTKRNVYETWDDEKVLCKRKKFGFIHRWCLSVSLSGRESAT